MPAFPIINNIKLIYLNQLDGAKHEFNNTIRMAMVGGGEGAIGAVHRIAARLDGEIKLVAPLVPIHKRCNGITVRIRSQALL